MAAEYNTGAMKLAVDTEIDGKSWDYFTLQHPEANVLQSWAWGEFQQSLGNKIWRFRVTDNRQIVAQLLAIKLSLGLGKNLIYAPRDLLINKSASAHGQHLAMTMIIDKIRAMAPQEKAILLRLDPPITHKDSTAISIYRSLGFMPSKKSIQPPENLIVDISPKEANILARMKPKTRYNIRLAHKKNVQVVISHNPDDIRIFNTLNQETAARNRFRPHSDTYYKKQFKTLGQADLMNLFIAYLDKTPLAAILVAFFGQRATYFHGASSQQHRDVMASYAPHWAAIHTAKEKNCSVYDLGGINDSGNSPAWSGITRFKEGFGGQVVRFVGTLELPLNHTWFRLYKLINSLRGQ